MQIEMKCLKMILLPWTGLKYLKSKSKLIPKNDLINKLTQVVVVMIILIMIAVWSIMKKEQYFPLEDSQN